MLLARAVWLHLHTHLNIWQVSIHNSVLFLISSCPEPDYSFHVPPSLGLGGLWTGFLLVTLMTEKTSCQYTILQREYIVEPFVNTGWIFRLISTFDMVTFPVSGVKSVHVSCYLAPPNWCHIADLHYTPNSQSSALSTTMSDLAIALP